MNNNAYLESYILINYNDTKEELLEIIRNIKNVETVEPTVGAFDVVTKIKTRNYEELKKIVQEDFNKIIDSSSALILTKKSDGTTVIKPENFISNKTEFENIFDCEFCGIALPHCHCVCPYCGQRDECECACGDAATGG